MARNINESERVLQGLLYHCPNEDNCILTDLLGVSSPLGPATSSVAVLHTDAYSC